MSAICGFFNRDQSRAASDDLARMARTIAYRGPAAQGSWRDGSIALSAALLLPGPGPQQKAPLFDPARRLAITADARLDNRDELCAALELPGRVADYSDVALILAGYARWREQLAERLLGDFAFAIWDAARQRLYCARDHFGVKQLYYFYDSRRFAFATEIKALLALPNVPQTINEQRIGALLLQLYQDQRQTLFENIFRLAPASWISVSASQITQGVYWRPDPRREIRLRSDAEYAAQFRELLREAVRVRLPASDPVGADLSGGIDSSAITCLARDLLAQAGREPLHSFTAVFSDTPQADELCYAQAVIGQGKLQPHFVYPEGQPALGVWGAEQWPDEPLLSPTSALSKLVYGAAQSQGVRVLLSGLGGDGVIGHGWEYLNELALKGRWLKLRREAAWLEQRYGFNAGKTVRNKLKLLAPQWLRGWRRRLSGHDALAPRWQPRLNEEFLTRSGQREHWAALTRGYNAPQPNHRAAQCNEFASGAYSSLSFVFTDRAAARFGLDLRFPYFDKRLVEFCVALPPEQKLRQGWTRWIARQALAGVLPPEVRTRTSKANFTPAANNSLVGVDRQRIEAALLEQPGAIADYIAMDDLQNRFNRLLQDPLGVEGRPVWLAAELALWHNAVQPNASGQ